jgi:hypothetical protein
MPRIDDFLQARDLARRELADHTIEQISARSGFIVDGSGRMKVPFLDREYHLTHPAFEFEDRESPETDIPLQEQVLILHYLQGCQPLLRGRWIAYREIPGAGFYWSAFSKRAIDPLCKVFGRNVEAFRMAADKLQASAVSGAEAGYRFHVLPYTPLQVNVWEGDEEFPAEANILFDATIGDYLSPEDAAWLASLTVYRLIALARPN